MASFALIVVPAISALSVFDTSGALGSSAWASPVGTVTISAGINVGAQYVQNGKLNFVDVGTSFMTGTVGTYGKFLWNVVANAIGGAANTAINNYFNVQITVF